MSFANILSGPAEEPPPRKPASPVQTYKTAELAPIAPGAKLEQASHDTSGYSQSNNHYGPPQDHHHHLANEAPVNGIVPAKAPPPPPPQPSSSKPQNIVSERDNETVSKALERLETLDKSDVESSGFDHEWRQYLLRGKKRARKMESQESHKRKVSTD